MAPLFHRAAAGDVRLEFDRRGFHRQYNGRRRGKSISSWGADAFVAFEPIRGRRPLWRSPRPSIWRSPRRAARPPLCAASVADLGIAPAFGHVFWSRLARGLRRLLRRRQLCLAASSTSACWFCVFAMPARVRLGLSSTCGLRRSLFGGAACSVLARSYASRLRR